MSFFKYFLFSIPTAIFDKMYERSFEFEKNSPIKMWIGPRLLVFLTDPRDVEVMYIFLYIKRDSSLYFVKINANVKLYSNDVFEYAGDPEQ